MKKTALARSLIVAILSLSSVFAAYYLANSSPQKESALPTATSTHTASPSPLVTPSPAPSPTPSPPEAAFVGPFGSFTVTSPTSGKINSNPVTLTINGEVFKARSVYLTVNYSLDGQPQIPFPVEGQPVIIDGKVANVPSEIVTGFVTLPNLSTGTHSITVFGDLYVDSSNPGGGDHLAQATVAFTVKG